MITAIRNREDGKHLIEVNGDTEFFVTEEDNRYLVSGSSGKINTVAKSLLSTTSGENDLDSDLKRIAFLIEWYVLGQEEVRQNVLNVITT